MQAAHHQQAAFCLEEAVLLSPVNLALHLLYAEARPPPPGPSVFSAAARCACMCLAHGNSTNGQR